MTAAPSDPNPAILLMSKSADLRNALMAATIVFAWPSAMSWIARNDVLT